MNMPRLLLLVTLPMAMLASSMTAEAGCSAAAKQYIQSQAAQADTLDQASRDAILARMVANPPPGIMGANGINDCVAQSWPSILGGTASILSGVGRQIVNQLCTQARSQIAAQTPSYLKGIYGTVQTAQSGNYGSALSGALNSSGVSSAGGAVGSAVSSSLNSSAGNSSLSGLFGGGTP